MQADYRVQLARSAVSRLSNFCAAIGDAHALGCGPGSQHDLANADFLGETVRHYRCAVPGWYLETLGLQFAGIASVLDQLARERAQDHSIVYLSQYLRCAAVAIGDQINKSTDTPVSQLALLPSAPPSVVGFTEIACLASPDGVRQLQLAADMAAESLLPEHTSLTRTEKRQLSLLSAGWKVSDIAAETASSERQTYRSLKNLRSGVGVRTNHELLVEATRRNWI